VRARSGPDRPRALAALRAALAALQVGGLPTNAAFLAAVAAHPAFVAGGVDTGFIEAHAAALLAPRPPPAALAALAAALTLALDARGAAAAAAAAGRAPLAGAWAAADGFRVNHELTEAVHLAHEAFPLALAATRRPGGDLSVRALFGGAEDAAAKEEELLVAALSVGEDEAAAEVGGARLRTSFSCYETAAEWVLDLWPRDGPAAGAHHQFRRPLARAWASAAGAAGAGAGAAAAGAGAARAPMPGRVAKVLVALGQAVAEGEALCAVEAMKMEHAVRRAFLLGRKRLHYYYALRVCLRSYAPPPHRAAGARAPRGRRRRARRGRGRAGGRGRRARGGCARRQGRCWRRGK
jgi:acetyl/propionyl-CoA carboxylase alpha subunit